MTLVKICGITNLEDALVSVDAGADALGFNFYPDSPRFIKPEDARAIIKELQEDLLTVGVFVNVKTPEDVRDLAAEAGVKALQLHGDESPEYCAALKDHHVIKAFRVSPDFDPQFVTTFAVDSVMLDGFHPNLRGGTGQLVDWAIASRAKRLVPQLFLAGGLNAENVTQAIEAVQPYAVDACSSLELAPGKKDADRIRAFVKAVRRTTLNVDAPH
jgi:phosphoribosylanthranilate isomerase